jgi:hypothetical protein
MKKYIVLFETKHFDWIAYYTCKKEAKYLLKINDRNNCDIFYIFQYDFAVEQPNVITLSAPLCQHYSSSSINIYKENELKENKDTMCIFVSCYDNSVVAISSQL